MKTLAFSTNTERMSWLIVEGTHSSPKVASARLEHIKLPFDVQLGSGLCSIIQTLSLLIDTQNPKQITILQPGRARFNNASSVRIKVEAALQIAAAQKAIPLYLVSPMRVSAYKKRLARSGSSIETLLNGGRAFTPREMGDVICVGIAKLPNV